MRHFQILITSIFLISASPAFTESLVVQEDLSSDFSVSSAQEDPLDAHLIEEEISFFDEEIEEFEDEIIALEEELKKDAESLIDSNTAAAPETLPDLSAAIPSVEAIEEATELFSNPVEPLALQAEEVQPERQLSQEMETPLFDEEVLAAPLQEMQTEPAHFEILPPQTQETAQLNSVEENQLIAARSEILNPPAVLKKKPIEKAIEVNFGQAFAGSPTIYSVLFLMSVTAVGIWIYNLLSLQKSVAVKDAFLKNLQNKLNSNQFDDALFLCTQNDNVFSKMIACGINSRRHGLPSMLDSMKGEGKRESIHFWQRMSLLNDIAIIAPMIGLLGTVLGMFYAFYDINRSIESIATLFDGLGVSVGTTVAGLVVAILALILHSTGKYRLVKVLARVENEAQTFATLIDDKTSIYKG